MIKKFQNWSIYNKKKNIFKHLKSLMNFNENKRLSDNHNKYIWLK